MLDAWSVTALKFVRLNADRLLATRQSDTESAWLPPSRACQRAFMDMRMRDFYGHARQGHPFETGTSRTNEVLQLGECLDLAAGYTFIVLCASSYHGKIIFIIT